MVPFFQPRALPLKSFQRSFEFTSRVIILVLFSYAFKLYVLIPIFGRWILMTAWILTIETNYHQNAWAEKAFQMIMGFLNVFLFFNMKDGSSKDVIIIYYSLNFLEGTINFFQKKVSRTGYP